MFNFNKKTTIPVIKATQSLQPVVTTNDFNDVYERQAYHGPKPTVLLILDGYGVGPENAGNAVKRAQKPNLDNFWLTFPHTQLEASGESVGLPHGEPGNTETGHLNIGAGTIVYQDLPRINTAIADGSFYSNPAFIRAADHVQKNNSVLHIIGLIGMGGVHSSIEHLYALLNLAKQRNITKVYIHGFTDGRDSPPKSSANYVKQIQNKCQEIGVGRLASLMGRYYAMDRDKRWERIQKAYAALTQGSQLTTTDASKAIQEQYDNGLTDEFIEPISILDETGKPLTIAENDAVIFFNYRIDRPRELTRAFTQPDFESGANSDDFDPYALKYEKSYLKEHPKTQTFQRPVAFSNLYFVTMTRYEKSLPVDVAFPPQMIDNPLCKVLADRGLKQLRMSETEKERFVTYYMNGQSTDQYPGEDRVIMPSKGAKSYDEIPEMSARELGDEAIKRIQSEDYDAIIINFANADMIGHTGNIEAAIRGIEILDEIVGKIVQEVYSRGGLVLITADHGNAEEMINTQTGGVDTEHSRYPVPLIIINEKFAGQSRMLPTGILADIAPTMLSLMGITKPDSMTGRVLI